MVNKYTKKSKSIKSKSRTRSKSIKSKSIKSKSIKSKSNSKGRKRILKGGVRSSSSSVSRQSSAAPISVVRHSVAASRPPGIAKSSVHQKINCCNTISIRGRQKIIDSIENFPVKFDDFYDELLKIPSEALPSKVEEIKEAYITKTTLHPQRAYLNMNGLKLINYLRSKYNKASDDVKQKILRIISLFDQYGMSQGVRYSDLPIIQRDQHSDYYKCYKKFYDEVYAKLFSKNNLDEYPVSLSAICHKPLQRIDE